MATTRRKQIEIGWAMVDFFKRHPKFSKDQLRKEMGMNTDNLNDWLALYQAFNIGPEVRTIKVNGNTIYEVIRNTNQTRVEVSIGIFVSHHNKDSGTFTNWVFFIKFINFLTQFRF